MRRLHDGHAGGHRLEDGEALGLLVGRRHREHVGPGEEAHFLEAIELAAIGELRGQTRLVHLEDIFVVHRRRGEREGEEKAGQNERKSGTFHGKDRVEETSLDQTQAHA